MTTEITVDDLHDAADGLEEEMIIRLGLTPATIEAFLNSAEWFTTPAKDTMVKVDPLSVALGLAVGAVAMFRKLEGTHD